MNAALVGLVAGPPAALGSLGVSQPWPPTVPGLATRSPWGRLRWRASRLGVDPHLHHERQLAHGGSLIEQAATPAAEVAGVLLRYLHVACSGAPLRFQAHRSGNQRPGA